jgi:hypothetical protein
MDVDAVLRLSATGVHDAVERWETRRPASARRALRLHVEGSTGDLGLADALEVRHRQQMLLQFRHVLVQHEVSLRAVPAGCVVSSSSRPHRRPPVPPPTAVSACPKRRGQRRLNGVPSVPLLLSRL